MTDAYLPQTRTAAERYLAQRLGEEDYALVHSLHTALLRVEREVVGRAEALHALLLAHGGGEIGLYPAMGGGWAAIIRRGGGDNFGASGPTPDAALAALAALTAPSMTDD